MKKVIVHGGAGDFSKADHDIAEYKEGVENAAQAGYDALATGNALDAVIQAVSSLEDNPLFNAGTGAVLNIEGEVEADAMVMFKGHVGAVGALRNMKNPVQVARLVMERTDHVFLVGEGAYSFGRHWFDHYDPVTNERRKKFEELRSQFLKGDTRWKKNVNLYAQHGTVGAVAFDGDLAAATSTGGIWLKLKGRVGDSPLAGCGTYAGEKAALSATGIGENIIRSVFSKSVHDLLPTCSLKEALQTMLTSSPETGAIAIDFHGNVEYAFNTNNMAWALCDQGTVLSFEVDI
ncbi:MAG: isoaspartyl peptidase/L-asparaginase [Theionarchaea archaeon]|nr:isoaspartyl peptidase/L-asparaginase [Theionarchaea archaeon]MBU7037680.1 isoaspartyl peptidase/L-asparaginase [Theionarchaea archaeon]